ncbi:MAG: hypothetical protein PHV20_04535 [Bacteroidales bacterium]|nr:hypothetical protein [Bacteroidales bacterium]
MNITYFLKLLIRRWMWLVILPIIAAVAIYFFTRKQPKTYQSSMTIYTALTSGVSLDVQGSVDYSQALIAYDNLINVLKSQKNLEDVGLRIIVRAMMFGEKNEKFMNKVHYQFLMSNAPVDLKKLINKKSEEETFANFYQYLKKSEDNFLYNLLYKSANPYCIAALSSVSLSRLDRSDLVEVSYKADDPGICYQALLILFDATKQNFQDLKTGQSNEVIKYFEQEKADLMKLLEERENSLLVYSQQNNIVNYEEQSKLIVSQKFGIEDRIDVLEMAIEGTRKSISELEKRLTLQNRLRLKSDQILFIRNQISKISAEAAAQTFYSKTTPTSTEEDGVAPIISNTGKLGNLKSQLRAAIDSVYLMQNTSEGITVQSILSEWLTNVIAYDQAKAQLPILEKRTEEVNQLFDEYSPVGANVKKQEREIGATEEQYLTVLNGLHSAKLKEKSEKLSAGSITILDSPSFPFSTLPDKASTKAVIAFLAVFLLILVLIILIEFLDTTINNVTRTERLSGLKVGFVYPLILNEKKPKVENLETVAAHYLALETLRVMKDHKDAVQINLLSLYSGEGKSFIKDKLETAFAQLDEQNGTDLSKKILVKDLPEISDKYFDNNQVSDNSLNVLVCRANRGWKTVDNRIVKLLIEQTGQQPIILLNGVGLSMLQTQWANFPVKRSKLGNLLIRIMHMEFSAKQKF